MDKLGTFIMPCIVLTIIIFGLIKKVPLFDTFLVGAREGFKSTIAILPSLVGLITAVTMLKASGALDMLSSAISPITNMFKIPSEIVPLMLLRPVSGSGSIAFLNNIFSSCGVDSFTGKIASVMMGSTETTFYAIAVYYGAVGIKNTRHTIPAAVCADIAGFIMSIITVKMFFGLG